MLTEEESAQLAALLAKMTWPVSLEVFYTLCAKTITVGVDLALIRTSGPMPEVLLTQRPPDDPFFPGLWHLPGGLVIPGQTGLSTIAKRALKADADIQLSVEPECVMVRDILMGPPGLHTSPRGQEIYRLYHYAMQEGDPTVAENETRRFYPLNQMPDQFILHQTPSIAKLREMYGV